MNRRGSWFSSGLVLVIVLAIVLISCRHPADEARDEEARLFPEVLVDEIFGFELVVDLIDAMQTVPVGCRGAAIDRF